MFKLLCSLLHGFFYWAVGLVVLIKHLLMRFTPAPPAKRADSFLACLFMFRGLAKKVCRPPRRQDRLQLYSHKHLYALPLQ